MAGLDGHVRRSGKFWMLVVQWVRAWKAKEIEAGTARKRKRMPDVADLKRHGQALALAAFVAMASSDRVEDSAALEYVLVVGILAFVGATVLGFAYLCGYSEQVRTCQCFQKQGENVYYILMLLLSIVAFLCGIFTSELDAAAEFSTVMILFLCGAYGASIALTIKERRDYESSMSHLASQGAPMPA